MICRSAARKRRRTRAPGAASSRFLFTDQIALLVARGFDLLDDEWVRDVIITQVSDREAVEKEVRDMDDV
jgi:hypothetical protein